MSDNVFDYIDSKLDPAPYTPSPELVASVDAYLAALNQPRVYFEHIGEYVYKAVFGDVVSYHPLATWAINDIDCMAHMSTEELLEEVCSK